MTVTWQTVHIPPVISLANDCFGQTLPEHLQSENFSLLSAKLSIRCLNIIERQNLGNKTMSISITRSPMEDLDIIRRLLNANLFDVFGQRDPAARTAAIAKIHQADVVWYEPDRVLSGNEAIDIRAGEILAEAPGCQFSVDGEAVVTQNLGVLNWNFGPPADPDMVKGTDIIVVEGGKIKVLWTAVTKIPKQK
jgi:hypothetical protein